MASVNEEHSPEPILPSCRLFGMLALHAPIGVLLRRGPSRWVQCVLWHTETDTFEYGQWFHGRVYERRCALSPDGRLLVYFASKFTLRTVQGIDGMSAWTAVSRPPYFTALTLWPKNDCWNGGGLFQDDQTLLLNHAQALPRGLTLLQQEQHARQYVDHLHVIAGTAIPWFARGEDYPLYPAILSSQGWQCVQAGVFQRQRPDGLWAQPQIWQKAQKPQSDQGYTLTLTYHTLRKCTYTLHQPHQGRMTTIEAEWADWDQRQRLVFVHEGRLFTLPTMDGEEGSGAVLLADFNMQRPSSVAAPEWATHWPD